MPDVPNDPCAIARAARQSVLCRADELQGLLENLISSPSLDHDVTADGADRLANAADALRNLARILEAAEFDRAQFADPLKEPECPK